MNQKWALVIQGGAVRASYSAGALEMFIEKDLYANRVYGCSCGSLLAADYTSHDAGRNYRLMTEAMKNPKFISPIFYITKGRLFNFTWLFEEAPMIMPFNLPIFIESETELTAVATNLLTGKPTYFTDKRSPNIYRGLSASCSMPRLSRTPVMVEGVPFLDGGVVERVPFHKAIEDGFEKIIVITTRAKDFRYVGKDEGVSNHEMSHMKSHFGDYPKFIEAYKENKKIYNEQMDELDKLEADGKVFIIAPKVAPNISSMETKTSRIKAVYDTGKNDAYELLPNILDFLRRD